MLKHVWTPKSSLFCTVHFLGPCTAGRGVLQHGRLLMHEHRQGCTIGTWSIITHLTLPCIIRERAVYDQNDMKNKPKKSQGSVMITSQLCRDRATPRWCMYKRLAAGCAWSNMSAGQWGTGKYRVIQTWKLRDTKSQYKFILLHISLLAASI